MDALLSAIDSQCNAVQRTATSAERVVDRLRHGLSVVSDRCTRIKRDVDDWELAVKRVDETADELEDAAAAYTIPRYVDAVVRGDSRDPAVMVKALTHLVTAKEYVETKPPNSVGERLERKVENSLQKALKATESFVTTSVMRALRPQVAPPSANAASSGPSASAQAAARMRRRSAPGGPPRLFRDDWRRQLGALHTIVEQHAMLFNRLDAAREVIELVGDRVLKHFDELLSIDYRRAHEGFDKDVTTFDDAGGLGAAGRRRGGVLAAMRFLFAAASARVGGGGGGRDGHAFSGEDVGASNRAAVISRYRHGDHPLPGFSRDLRELLVECCGVVTVVILKAFPTSEDDHRYHRQIAVEHGEAVRDEAFQLLSELVLRIADAVFDRAQRALAHVARAPDIGIHDAIFAALDIVMETWQWRRVARGTPGDNDAIKGEVDENVTSLMKAALQLLDDFQFARGAIDREELVRSSASDDYFEAKRVKLSACFLQLIGVHSRELGENPDADLDAMSDEEPEDDEPAPPIRDTMFSGSEDGFSDRSGEGAVAAPKPKKKRGLQIPRSVRLRWLPPLDGAVHPSTTSLVRFLKHLLGGYQAVLCLTLAGSCEDADAMLEAQRKAASTGQGLGDWASGAEEYMDSCISGHLADIEAIADAAATTHAEEDEDIDSPFAPFNRPLFMANNLFFVLRSLREDSPFASTARNRKACEAAIAMYDDRLDLAIDNYAALWTVAMPSWRDDPELSAAEDNYSEELSKPQRAAVKVWYERASKAVERMCHASRTHVVAQSALRSRLSNAAADAVSDIFHRFDSEIVRERRWSNRPERHLAAPVDELVAMVRAIFGAARSSDAPVSRPVTTMAFSPMSFQPMSQRNEEL